MLSFNLHSPRDTIQFGISLSKLLTDGTVVCIKGDLGAGKTTLVKGIAEGMGVNTIVTSPTFTIINEYCGKLPLYHIDTYRMENEQELLDIGIEEYLPPAHGITVIEWPEIITNLLPEHRLEIELYKVHDNEREIRLKTIGSKYKYLLREMKNL